MRIAPTNSDVLLAWPASTITFSLQQNSDLGTTNWIAVTNSVTVLSNGNQVVLSPLGTNAFYRLKYP